MAATVLAVQNGADILRVHDVEDTYKLIKTINRISKDINLRVINEIWSTRI